MSLFNPFPPLFRIDMRIVSRSPDDETNLKLRMLGNVLCVQLAAACNDCDKTSTLYVTERNNGASDFWLVQLNSADQQPVERCDILVFVDYSRSQNQSICSSVGTSFFLIG